MHYLNLQEEKDILYESYVTRQIEAANYRSKADEIALWMQEISCKMEEAELEHSRLICFRGGVILP